MSAWTQAGKQQVRDAFGARMRAAGRPERQMSVTALRRFGTETLAHHGSPAYEALHRYGVSRRWIHVGAPSEYESPAVTGAVCDRESLTRPLRAWEARPACCMPPGDDATYFDHLDSNMLWGSRPSGRRGCEASPSRGRARGSWPCNGRCLDHSRLRGASRAASFGPGPCLVRRDGDLRIRPGAGPGTPP